MRLKQEKDYVIENLGLLLGSGLGVLDSLKSIKSEMRSKKMLGVLESLIQEVDGGSSLWKALEKTGIFSAQVISLIRLGEESGQLEQNFKLIAVQKEKQRIFKSKIRSAMIYPLLVVSLTIIVGLGISWFILPRLATVFDQIQGKLPLITKVLIVVGGFLGQYGWFAIPAFLLLLACLIYFFFFFGKTKFIGHFLIFKTPGIKKLIGQIEIARFGYVLGSLLEAGLPIIQALDSLKKTTNFYFYKKFYRHLRDSVDQGNSFQKSFKSYPKIEKLMPSPIQQMIVTGEKTGQLSGMLKKIGQTLEPKIDATTKNFAVILEPILLIIVWIGVVAIAMAVILPVYSLIGGFNR